METMETSSGVTSEHRESPRILIVDDDASVREVLSVLLSEEGYRCICAPDAPTALALLPQGIQLVISDLKMPEHDGIWLLDRAHEQCPDVPIIMLTGYGDTDSAVSCLRRGAADYLIKPPKLLELVRAIERALAKYRIALERRLYQQRLEQSIRDTKRELQQTFTKLEGAYNSTLLGLVAALDAREHETGDHSLRVARYAAALACRMSLPDDEIHELRRGALLHDIGKIGVSDSILLKPGPLDSEEWAGMRRHPEVGFAILQQIDYLAAPSKIVLTHHERFDGTGYPYGLMGQDIPIGARIFTIADTLDAITSDRPYRAASSFEMARDEILRCSGTQFDPILVDAFMSIDAREFESLRRPSSGKSVFDIDAPRQAEGDALSKQNSDERRSSMPLHRSRSP
ncbi:MAG: response regulator [Myxococcales bacterium]|jgi:putative nucleotidyltransferase with HDIG domain|nr:response regulator [Myxococcales bacterium]